ncbi:LacI family DNA-binding transcriptional regulator [Microbacterium sp. NPDC091313]
MAVTVREVAERAGVSVGTVSNVLNGRSTVAPEAERRVRAAIDDLGYVRNDAARQLRAGRSRSLGLVVPDAANPFFAAIARGAERRAADDGLVVLLGSSEQDADRERTYLELFQEQRVNGVLLSPAGDDLCGAERLIASGIPVALVDRDAPLPGAASVSMDDERGGYDATRHLLAAGRRRIAFLAGPAGIRQVDDRLAGARRAVGEVQGARLDVVAAAGMTVLDGRDAVEHIRRLDPMPDAVFAANDLLAVGALQALSILGDVRVPLDVALIGYDDIDFAAAAVVPLSSMRQPAELLGWTAADLVLRADGAGERVRFDPELVARASTAG